jgi:hypothetical protein
MDYTAVGQTTHLAGRMEQLASPGSILLAPSTLHLVEGFVRVRSLGTVPVKGLAEPVEVHEVTGVGPARTRLQAAASRGLVRFVGRDDELEHLRRALQRAGAGQGQVTAVVGAAGVGKSRLVHEFAHSRDLDGWRVLEAASVSYSRATSYLPVIEFLRGYFAIGDRDELRAIREKVAGRLLTLDRSLEPALPALLALLDVPVDDPAWRGLEPRSVGKPRSTPSSGSYSGKRASSRCWWSSKTSTGSMARPRRCSTPSSMPLHRRGCSCS